MCILAYSQVNFLTLKSYHIRRHITIEIHLNVKEHRKVKKKFFGNGAVEIFNFSSPLLCMLVYSGRLIIAPT
jgi:hypothetical protein